MNSATQTPAPTSQNQPATPAPKRRPWLLYGCGGLLALLLLIIATVAITIWWIQRPIKPVVLSDKEKAAVEAKLQRIGVGSPGASGERASASKGIAEAEASTPGSADRTKSKQAPERLYVPGGKTLRLTEREINGLLNANTDLGQSVRIEFEKDAVNAYLAVPIPKDFPVGGGKMFRARGRFRLSLGNEGAPFAILDDVTVFGLSLPKAWLGGLKGENLLGEAMGQKSGGPGLKGIKSLRVEPGALVLEVED